MTAEPRRHVVLPETDSPAVSVIVLAWRARDGLRSCLAAVARQRTDVSFETIVVLNGASPAVVELVERDITGARVFRSGVNLGFSGGCNRGAAHARGQYLVFLNDDTEVQDGWLQELVDTAESHPEAGAVGSRVVDFAGKVQEAGGIVWRDGSVWHLGRLDPRTSPRYRYVRRVDYCSACSILVRRETWEAVGGFDEGYFPGYYEDLDLCLSIDRAGQSILYAPGSEVIHAGGGPSGSLDAEYKTFVARRSKDRFMARWGASLGLQPPLPDAPPYTAAYFEDVERALQTARRIHRRVLIVDDCLAGPGEGPLYEWMAAAAGELAASGAGVTVFAGAAPRSAERLGRAGIELLDEDLIAHLARPSILYDAVVVAGAERWSELAGTIREHQPQAPVVYAARAVRHQAPLLDADRVVCMSGADARIASQLGTPADVVRPLARRREGADLDAADRPYVLVVARPTPDNPPGPQWTDWFARLVLPRLQALVPWARVQVVGPEWEPLAAASTGPGVAALTAWPENRAPVYARSRVAVVVSGGAPWVVDALEHGVPVVASPVALEGFEGDSSSIIVTNDPDRMAEAAAGLLTDLSRWEQARDQLRRTQSKPAGAPPTSWTAVVDAARRDRVTRVAASRSVPA